MLLLLLVLNNIIVLSQSRQEIIIRIKLIYKPVASTLYLYTCAVYNIEFAVSPKLTNLVIFKTFTQFFLVGL